MTRFATSAGRRRSPLCAVGLVILGSAGGCARSDERAPASGPADIAVRYTAGLYSADPNQAAPLVAPDSRGEFQVIAALSAGRTLSSSGLRAGAVAVRGNSAAVTVLGTLCGKPKATAATASPASAAPTCVSNADAASTNPQFTVSLVKAADGNWYVDFPEPRAGPEQSSGATPPPSTG